jgi:hypothetical protein
MKGNNLLVAYLLRIRMKGGFSDGDGQWHTGMKKLRTKRERETERSSEGKFQKGVSVSWIDKGL